MWRKKENTSVSATYVKWEDSTLTYNRFLKFNQPNSSQYQNFDKLCPEKTSLITNPCCAATLKGKILKKNKFSNHLLSVITTRGKACLRLVSFLPSVWVMYFQRVIYSLLLCLPLIPRTNGLTGLKLIVLC